MGKKLLRRNVLPSTPQGLATKTCLRQAAAERSAGKEDGKDEAAAEARQHGDADGHQLGERDANEHGDAVMALVPRLQAPDAACSGRRIDHRIECELNGDVW